MKRNFRFSFTLLLCAHLALCLYSCAPLQLSNHQATYLVIGNEIEEDSETAGFIAPYKRDLEQEMNSVIGESKKELNTKGTGESSLGNLVADLQKKFIENKLETTVDISVINNGGLRNIIPEGPITVGNIYELSPFENFIYLLEMKAEDLRRLAKYSIEKKNLGIQGIYIEAIGNEIQQFKVNGESLDENRTYVMAINDYLANGGDYMDFLQEVKRLEKTNFLLRDMLLEEISSLNAEGEKVDASIEGRQIYR
ncbi:5'-nucleotidase C-terminal domain-containing protein [Pleomorphovibrio marinus]|uniref:5'-nucleotidase C-terminal domain-containing protein n=1 Tax=Pleomorphovibrio marinus TaxID=2164132 RepID=UPI000E0CA7D3|nr:5'-nucleotidase [Pleomorphovibrio marinus]